MASRSTPPSPELVKLLAEFDTQAPSILLDLQNHVAFLPSTLLVRYAPAILLTIALIQKLETQCRQEEEDKRPHPYGSMSCDLDRLLFRHRLVAEVKRMHAFLTEMHAGLHRDAQMIEKWCSDPSETGLCCLMKSCAMQTATFLTSAHRDLRRAVGGEA